MPLSWVFGRHAGTVETEATAKTEHSFFSKIAGVSYDNADHTSRQAIIKAAVRPGDVLVLVFEDANPFDPNAIALFSTDGRQIGYLNASLAEEVRSWTSKGRKVNITVKDVTGGGPGEHVGVNIFIEVFCPALAFS